MSFLPASVSEVAYRMVINVLWSRLPRKSVVSGLWIRTYENTPLFPNCFLNVLPVHKYPYFRYYMKGIVLVTPGEAGLWTQGTEEERIQYSMNFEEKSRGKSVADWSVLKRLEEELMVDYKKVFPSTRGILIDYHYSLDEQKNILGTLNKKYLSKLK
jgi:hypothetical protein